MAGSPWLIFPFGSPRLLPFQHLTSTTSVIAAFKRMHPVGSVREATCSISVRRLAKKQRGPRFLGSTNGRTQGVQHAQQRSSSPSCPQHMASELHNVANNTYPLLSYCFSFPTVATTMTLISSCGFRLNKRFTHPIICVTWPNPGVGRTPTTCIPAQK